MNPIVIKEVRQAVRSKFISGMLLLFLFLLLVVAMIILLTSVAQGGSSALLEAGQTLFAVLISLLYGVCILFVPAYTGIRLAAERWSPQMDLFYITTVTPASIVRGKLLSGVIITLLIYSVAMPFVAFTYPMRGVDLPSAFIILVLTFCIVIIVIQAVIFLALLPVSRFFRVLLAIGCLPLMIGTLSWTYELSDQMLMSGVGSSLFSSDFWKATAYSLAVGFSIFWMLHILSIALITPKTMNRALPLRVWITLIWALWGIAAFIISVTSGTGVYLRTWLRASIQLFTLSLLIIASESDTLSMRIRRTIPRGILRAPAFLLYNGTAGGILWILLLLFVTIFVTRSCSLVKFGNESLTFLAYFFYVYAYVLTAHLIWQIFLNKYIKKSRIYLIAVFAILLGALLPLLVDVIVHQQATTAMGAWRVFNVFGLLYDSDNKNMVLSHLFAASAWSFCITLMHLPYFIKFFMRFKRPAAEKTS